jgi:hypothetical protein
VNLEVDGKVFVAGMFSTAECSRQVSSREHWPGRRGEPRLAFARLD